MLPKTETKYVLFLLANKKSYKKYPLSIIALLAAKA